MITIIQSNSKGNAILYKDVLVDIGVSYKKLAPYLNEIKIILLTHIHGDHFNKSTIAKVAKQKPLIRFVCCEWLVDPLLDLGVRNIDCLELNKLYDFGFVQVSPFKLYHLNSDMSICENCGWRIFSDKKIFHATDTEHLEGITAIGYDVYAIEGNYDEVLLDFILEHSTEYEHGHRSKLTHLSIQQRERFINENARGKYEGLLLHPSSTYGGIDE